MMSIRAVIIRLAFAAIFFGVVADADLSAPPPRPAAELTVNDVPNDDGTALKLSWQPSPDDQPGTRPPAVSGYRIQRSSMAAEAKELAVRSVPEPRNSSIKTVGRGMTYALYPGRRIWTGGCGIDGN